MRQGSSWRPSEGKSIYQDCQTKSANVYNHKSLHALEEFCVFAPYIFGPINLHEGYLDHVSFRDTGVTITGWLASEAQ
jgi:hypothetical protein